MSQTNTVTCPNCQHQFNIEAAISADIEKEIKQKYTSYLEKQKKEYEQKDILLKQQLDAIEKQKSEQEEVLQQRLQQEKLKLTDELKKQAFSEVELKIKNLEQDNLSKNEKLKEAQAKELDLLKKQQELNEQKQAMELDIQRRLMEGQKQIEEKIRASENERNELRFKEKDKQVDDLKKLVEEMRRKSEQGSMQLQGEVQELALEEMLKNMFPFDLIEEVGKGIRGADAVQIVRNNLGQTCGRIIYESKRTKAFTNEWIEKLKSDMRSTGADIAVIVTETMPKDMERFGQKDGVWICNFAEAKSLAVVLRDSLVRIHSAMASQDNKGDKMQMLYDYLTGNEFKQQMEAIVEGFMSMRLSITKERMQMEKLWKEREKQLDKVLLNATGFYGSVKGIAGSAVADIKLLEGDTEDLNLLD
ncbi:MAG: DUF2130 domain-containing protein [Bacteroidota bacterium]